MVLTRQAAGFAGLVVFELRFVFERVAKYKWCSEFSCWHAGDSEVTVPLVFE